MSFGGEEILESQSFSQSQENYDVMDLHEERMAMGSSFIDREEGVKECQRE